MEVDCFCMRMWKVFEGFFNIATFYTVLRALCLLFNTELIDRISIVRQRICLQFGSYLKKPIGSSM